MLTGKLDKILSEQPVLFIVVRACDVASLTRLTLHSIRQTCHFYG